MQPIQGRTKAAGSAYQAGTWPTRFLVLASVGVEKLIIPFQAEPERLEGPCCAW